MRPGFYGFDSWGHIVSDSIMVIWYGMYLHFVQTSEAIGNALKRLKNTRYHLCFESDNIDRDIQKNCGRWMCACGGAPNFCRNR